MAVAFAARARWPRAELVALVVATMLPDLADFALPQGNRCRANCGLFTHAFPAFVVLAAVAAALAWMIWHRRAAAYLAAAMVCSHIALDLLTGNKQFWVGGPTTGFILYQHEAIDFAMEALMMIGAWMALRRARGAPRVAITVWTLALLLLIQGSFDFWLSTRGERAQRARPAATSPAQ